MLDSCRATAVELNLQFNAKKSHCIAFGKLNHNLLRFMVRNNSSLAWVLSVKYLGVHLVSGKKLSFDIKSAKRSFFMACNAILSHTKHTDEIIQLSLQESYCLPILTYGVTAISLNVSQYNELNACWNSVYRRLFGFHKWESVRSLIDGFARLDFKHLVMTYKVRFYKKLVHGANSVMSDSFYVYMMDTNFVVECLTVFHAIGAAIDRIRTEFVSGCRPSTY